LDNPDIEGGANSATVAAGQLRAFIERVEQLLADRAAISEDIAQVYAEMKGTGFDTKAVRTIVKMRKKDSAALQEEMAMVELYGSALGMGVFG
jgi:uncharacterized protein (UPF0335 family)